MAQTPTSRTAAADRSWTITGASAETREKVKAAAEAEGLSIRAWVDKTLNAAADRKPSPVAAIDPKQLADISSKLDDILKKLPDDPKAAEKATSDRISVAVLKTLAAGLQEMQRTAKDQVRIAEGKPAKKKAKKPATNET